MERLFHSLLDLLVASAEMVPKAIGLSLYVLDHTNYNHLFLHLFIISLSQSKQNN